MPQRYELTDAQWRLIEPLLPKQRRGGKWRPHREMLNAIFWVLRSGAAWRDLPRRYGAWQSAYDRFARFEKDGTWDRLVAALQQQALRAGALEPDLAFLDSTIVRASRAAAGAKKGGQLADAWSRTTMHWGAREGASRRSSTSCATWADSSWRST